jgi:hypothetical protein
VSGDPAAEARGGFSALSGTQVSTELMESFLQQEHDAGAKLARALQMALDAWSVGSMALGEAGVRELPPRETIEVERQQHIESGNVEAALLEREAKSAIRYRPLARAEIASLLRG